MITGSTGDKNYVKNIFCSYILLAKTNNFYLLNKTIRAITMENEKNEKEKKKKWKQNKHYKTNNNTLNQS